jgi:hypothetical protein
VFLCTVCAQTHKLTNGQLHFYIYRFKEFEGKENGWCSCLEVPLNLPSFSDEAIMFCISRWYTRQILVEFTQPLTEMSTRNMKIMFLGSKVRLVRRADNLTVISAADCVDNVGSLTSL